MDPGQMAGGLDVRTQLANQGITDIFDLQIAEYMVQDRGFPLDEMINLALREAQAGRRLADSLRASGAINAEEYLILLARMYNLEPVRLIPEVVEEDMAKSLLTPEQATNYRAIPYSRDDLGRLLVAIDNPGVEIREGVQKALSREKIVFQLAASEELETWIQRIYDPETQINTEGGEDGETPEQSYIVREAALDSHIIRLVDDIINKARSIKASDIHLEPGEVATDIRFRIDGVLRSVSQLGAHDTPKVIARIKTMAQMRVDEHRLPQDGRATTLVGPERAPLDLRVVTAPTIYGEQVAIRLLDPAQAMLSLEHLGMSDANLGRYLEAISRPHGVCLVTGPTGSGKSTTLYSSLARIVTPEKKLISIEDPVEYRLSGITQIDVSSGGNAPRDADRLNFARALRAILRSDPDIIMVGEIRDQETAQISVDAALTGHFLYSTLHTNSAVGSVVRLERIGVDRFLVAEAVEVIVAQRLIRCLCECKTEIALDEPTLQALEAPDWARQNAPAVIYQASAEGCPSCAGIGYRGRTGVHEVLLMTDELRKAIVKSASAEELERIAREQGMLGLREDALQKVWAGYTSAEEMKRVTA